ncbi:MAG: putative bifunctional diguanylate cyclase/phosphodiesterase [Allosphingosinicella sp.]
MTKGPHIRAADPAEIRINSVKARAAERNFALFAAVYAASIGALAARALLANDDALVHLLLFSVCMVAMITAVRNHHRPRIVLLQLSALVAPVLAAMATREDPSYWLLAAGSGLLAYTIAAMSGALYRGVRRNLEVDEQLYRQNLRFEAALDNMAQGLAMFEPGGRLLLCNARYLEMYGLSAEVVKPGTPLHVLIEHSIAVGNHPGRSTGELTAAFREKFAVRSSSTFHNQLECGRTISVCYEPMRDGGWVTTHEDITERQAAEARIAYLARHDPLTDLPNRVVLSEALDSALVRTARGEQVAVMCLDLDRFKAVNDTLGHSVGDALLRQVAARLKDRVRETDVVARLGGDEFAIVEVGSVQPTGATQLADRVISALSQPFHIDGHEISVGCSIGISIAPEDGRIAEQLLRNADLALYRAKSEGRGQHRFFAAEMDERMQVRRRLELDLRRALGAGEFQLAYQPLITVESGAVAGFEALLRWEHPVRGLVMPDEFIPLAEEIGLIVPIGDWVLRDACATAAAWPRGTRVAVNLSPVQFRGGNLVQSVIRALSASGLAPECLELEITEGVLLTNSSETLEMLHSLRGLGVRVAMDDFGTGYSSLSYLRAFPFDKIKIDRSFVHDILEDPEAMAIVRAVTDLGRSLGMSTTAEGIETKEQLAQLRLDGCTEVQGYLLGRPMDAGEALALVGGAPPALLDAPPQSARPRRARG